PPLASFALRFGPPEYFALLILGLLVLAYMSSGSMVKALAMATLGLLLGMIGIDQMTGYFRFAYGVVELGDGIGVVPVAVGLFGLSEILATAGQETPPAVIKPTLRELLPSRQEWKDANWPIWRGTVLGFLIGIIPGSAHIGTAVLLTPNLPLVGVFVNLLREPYPLLYPGILVFCILGVYAVNSSVVDVWIMLVMGLVGYLLRKLEFELAPIVLGVILAPMIEMALRQSLAMSDGQYAIFLTRPIATTLLAVGVLLVLLSFKSLITHGFDWRERMAMAEKGEEL